MKLFTALFLTGLQLGILMSTDRIAAPNSNAPLIQQSSPAPTTSDITDMTNSTASPMQITPDNTASSSPTQNFRRLPASIQCEDQQALREKRVKELKGQKINRLVKCANDKTQFTWKKHFADLRKIEEAYAKYNITLTYPELKTWFDKDGAYTQWLKRWKQQSKGLKGEDKSLYVWIDRGAMKGFQTAMTAKPLSANQVIYAWTTQPEWYKKLVKLLFRASGSYVSVIRTDAEKNPLTPFVAKTILFENLRMKLKPDEFNKLVNELELKITYLTKYTNSYIPLSANDSVSVHNGYVYGAPAGLALNYESDENTTRAMDCSTLVQSCLEESFEEKMIHDETRVRLTTNALFQVMERDTRNLPTSYFKYLQDSFDFVPLTSEEQLNPGDIFFIRGHMAIFAGYEKVNDEWVPVTYEATGGEHRLTGRFQRYFKSKKGCENPFLGKPGEKIYILRLTSQS